MAINEVESLRQKAEKLLKKKNYLAASEALATACEVYSKAHGGEDNPDLLWDYGRALFEYAKSNSSLFNSDVSSVAPAVAAIVEDPNFRFAPEEDDSEEHDDDTTKSDKGTKAVSEAGIESQAARKSPVGAGESDGEDAGSDGEDQANDENEDDFAAAWSIIDLARVLLEKKLENCKDDPEQAKGLKMKLADIHASLGEISLEDDNHPQAVEDFTTSLELKKELYSPESRDLSEAHYMLGLTYEAKASNKSDQELALEHLSKALSIAKACNIEADVIAELKDKVHEIELDIKHNTLGAGRDSETSAKEAAANAVSELISGASDISSLVKKSSKKRKAPEQEAVNSAKR